ARPPLEGCAACSPAGACGGAGCGRGVSVGVTSSTGFLRPWTGTTERGRESIGIVTRARRGEPGEEGGVAVALVRVYCGLATADPLHRSADPGPALVAVAVDDLGRTLDVRELTDDARGYARLTSLLAERSSDPYSVAVAVDSEDQLVPQLLITAGWATAVTDRSAGDAYAERFADPLAGTAAPLRRRALGMARALRAGLLAATALPPPAGLAELKPLLAAETALATGRHG